MKAEIDNKYLGHYFLDGNFIYLLRQGVTFFNLGSPYAYIWVKEKIALHAINDTLALILHRFHLS